MISRFVACTSCRRHVKQTDATCPFCGAAAPHFAPMERRARVRTTRAAMIAAGTAGSLAALIDCSSSSSGANVTAFYGVACTGSECYPVEDAGTDASSVVFYGIACTGGECLLDGGDAAADAVAANDAAADAGSRDGATGDAETEDAASDATPE